MKKNIFVISTIFLGMQHCYFQSENSDLQANKISEVDRYYNNVIARGMNADDPVYKALDRSNTKIQVNMNK